MPSRPAPLVTVYANGQADSTLMPIACQRSAGASRLDYCILSRDMGRSGARVQNLQLSQGIDTEIEIVGTLPLGGDYVYSWGKLSRQKVIVGQGEERIEYVARVEPFHFGDPMFGMWIYNPQFARVRHCDLPLVFNPIIDGKTEGNMRDEADEPTMLCKLFQHPESVRTDEAEQEQETGAKLWTITEAVKYLCRVCNPNQVYISNPTNNELLAAFNDERDTIRNIAIPDGTYLPQALDLLLKPFGYMWYIDYQGRGANNRVIKFFKRSVISSSRSAKMQSPGQYFARALTDTAGFDIEFDVSEMANQVLGLGGFVEIEETFELYRAWSTSDDALANSPDQLVRTDADFAENKDVWRKWVLNEAGDYNGLRDDITRSFDFTYLADQYTGEDFAPPKRRRFLPMLSLNHDKSPIGKIDGISVQYWDANAEEWVDVVDECQVLTRECGVYFTGKHPPEEIMRFGDDAAVRVTATVRFDTRIKYLAERQPSSPNADAITIVLDLADRFQYRKAVQTNVIQDGGTTLAVNDYTKLAYYCEQIRDAWDMAAVSGPVQLEGIDNPNYLLGQSLIGIVGREISFNAKSPGANSQAYPQIIGLTYDFQKQRTTLMIDQFRKDKIIERRSVEDKAENVAKKFNKRTGE